MRDTGEAAIRVDGSHCTKSVTAAATYDTDDEAVAIANNSIYGLSGEGSSADTERAPRVAQRMRTGSVTVNGSTFFGIARWAAPNRADWADARRAGLQGIPRNQDHRPARLMKFCATSAKVSLSV